MLNTAKSYRIGIRDQLRLSTIPRWQIVDLDRQQSVAEHTLGVMMIAMDIVREWKDIRETRYVGEELAYVDFQEVERVVMQSALYHDLPEIYTGDIPTPMKQAMGPEAMERIKQIERSFLPKPVASGREAVIIKCADIIEGMHFLAPEHGRHAKSAKSCMDSALVEVMGGDIHEPDLYEAVKTVYQRVTQARPVYLEDLL